MGTHSSIQEFCAVFAVFGYNGVSSSTGRAEIPRPGRVARQFATDMVSQNAPGTNEALEVYIQLLRAFPLALNQRIKETCPSFAVLEEADISFLELYVQLGAAPLATLRSQLR